MIEVLVTRVQNQIVLKDQGRQSNVVCWNWRALFPFALGPGPTR